jgi:2-amino-4-hydroxy-6-hydroxymethyldihydropteridine diphosphokinase
MYIEHKIYIGIGSNIHRKKHIKMALSALDKKFGKLLLSPIYETAAVGFEGDNFYNLVSFFKTNLNLPDIESILKDIEDQSGRDRTQKKFSARTLDIDLLLFDEEILHSQGIDIPRNEILKYSFVLKPLVDIAPSLIHPETNKSMVEHWNLFQLEHKKEVEQIKEVYL